MPIKNYTTKIDPAKTLGEIQAILARHGAEEIQTRYRGGEVEACSFSIPFGDVDLVYRLPCNWQGVLQVLREDGVARSMLTEEHARRVAWRILKDWIDAQTAIVEAGAAELAEVFLPYLMVGGGRTAFQVFTEHGPRALGPAEIADVEVVDA